MIKRVFQVGVALAVGLMTTAVFLSQLIYAASPPTGSSGVYCVVPKTEPIVNYAACDGVFQSVQTAVSTAPDGSEVWVAAGLYSETQYISQTFSTQLVAITRSLIVRGGYAPPFTDPPNFTANPTILDAQEMGAVVYLFGAESTLEGFYITGAAEDETAAIWTGYATATLKNNVIYENEGAIGLLAFNSTIDASNNLFRDNIAFLSPPIAFDLTRMGGGAVAAFGSIVMLDGNTIVGNVGLSQTASANFDALGGGVWAEDSVLTMTNNVVQGNTAVFTGTVEDTSFNAQRALGGGIALVNTEAYLGHNTLQGNVAAQRGISGIGGGLYVSGNKSLTLLNNEFISNTATVDRPMLSEGLGGGLALYLTSGESPTATIRVANNLFQQNIAAQAAAIGSGGGIGIIGPSELFDNAIPVELVNNQFISNTALVSGSIGYGGGLFLVDIEAALWDNQFVGNQAAGAMANAGMGGGLMHRAKLTLAGDIFQGNAAVAAIQGVGGAIGVASGELQSSNVVMLDNQASSSGSALSIIGNNSYVEIGHATIVGDGTGGSSGIMVVDERIFDPDDTFGSNQLAITNSILVSHSIGISTTGQHTVSVNGVLWYETGVKTAVDPQTSLTLANELTGDPHFATDGYHITAASAARGSGVASSVVTDIDGQGRPFSPDLGADQYWVETLYFPISHK